MEVPPGVTGKCRVRLESPPDCTDFRAQRGYVICRAQWVGVRQEGKTLSQAMKDAWVEVHKVCPRGGSNNP